MNKVSRKIKAFFKLKLKQYILKKHRCSTWREYYLRNDPRLNIYADRISEWYNDYKYVTAFEHSNVDPWIRFGSWLEGLTEIRDWCDKNCKGRWREDIHRVYKNSQGNAEPEFVLNEMASDVLFFAFTDEKDYIWFKLKWT